MISKKEIKCPHCGLLSFYTEENKFRPFCSERCRMIDLGHWAAETYRVPLKNEEGYKEDDIEGFDEANSDLHIQEEE
jgi:endogenous inhibitor of DNA gyrase (YacG/DUF329 family)